MRHGVRGRRRVSRRDTQRRPMGGASQRCQAVGGPVEPCREGQVRTVRFKFSHVLSWHSSCLLPLQLAVPSCLSSGGGGTFWCRRVSCVRVPRCRAKRGMDDVTRHQQQVCPPAASYFRSKRPTFLLSPRGRHGISSSRGHRPNPCARLPPPPSPSL